MKEAQLYIARLKHKDADGRLLRKVGKHMSCMSAWRSAVEKFGENNVLSVQVSKRGW